MKHQLTTIINSDGFFEAQLEPIYPNQRKFREDILQQAIATFFTTKGVPVFSEISGGDRYFLASTANPKALLIELSEILAMTNFLFKEKMAVNEETGQQEIQDEPLPCAVAAAEWKLKAVWENRLVLLQEEEGDEGFEEGKEKTKEVDVLVDGLVEFWRSEGATRSQP